MCDKISNSAEIFSLYATIKPVTKKSRFRPHDHSAKIQKIDNNSYLIKQVCRHIFSMIFSIN